VLVQQAAITHYQTDGFDNNQYLDKLFHLRVNLTALQPSGIGHLVEAELIATVGRDGTQTAASVLREGLGAEPAAVKAAFQKVFFVRDAALAEAKSITSRLPGQLKQPDLGGFISARLLESHGLADSLAENR